MLISAYQEMTCERKLESAANTYGMMLKGGRS